MSKQQQQNITGVCNVSEEEMEASRDDREREREREREERKRETQERTSQQVVATMDMPDT